MSRYVTRAAILYQAEDEQQILGGEVVYQDEAIPTGLLDAYGTPLYRIDRQRSAST